LDFGVVLNIDVLVTSPSNDAFLLDTSSNYKFDKFEYIFELPDSCFIALCEFSKLIIKETLEAAFKISELPLRLF
jgi:hypothetical protein